MSVCVPKKYKSKDFQNNVILLPLIAILNFFQIISYFSLTKQLPISLFSKKDEPITPFRELIKKYPGQAMKVLNHCNNRYTINDLILQQKKHVLLANEYFILIIIICTIFLSSSDLIIGGYNRNKTTT